MDQGTERTTRMLDVLRQGNDSFLTTRVDAVFNWARKYSMWPYPFATACCAMEFMSVWGPRYDISRFGWEIPRFYIRSRSYGPTPAAVPRILTPV